MPRRILTGLAKIFSITVLNFILLNLSYSSTTVHSSSNLVWNSGLILWVFIFLWSLPCHVKLILNTCVCFSPVKFTFPTQALRIMGNFLRFWLGEQKNHRKLTLKPQENPYIIFFLFLEKINAFIRQKVMQMLDIFYLSSKCNVKAPTIVDSILHSNWDKAEWLMLSWKKRRH